ncbi:hypothetical protein CYV19_17685 [Natronobacterium gregoryi SP2]|uniref:Uncharacterized protein n=1 Tax=Natronobacterium gregoryi (strain ATCC 43098 / DSM 3393 / CCM 3738 / CIP 104747 / IAM 13177 / JCM 8860 / NBRC 102187 / NCIMB 2189 / SP2) TaxID=797304 RepID=L9Y3F3_NATGS|nr:hypothetical protein C490_09328 [Natronobacterium gregoryi SP2]PLK18495.1 hypothetical protein CYV19_17685 [Natronobacterium gregoryi SP2]
MVERRGTRQSTIRRCLTEFTEVNQLVLEVASQSLTSTFLKWMNCIDGSDKMATDLSPVWKLRIQKRHG